MKPYFIVGTGRCGSTMLSNLVKTHPDILSVSEFFSAVTDMGGRIPEMFSAEDIDGVAFWAKIAAIMPRKNTMIKQDVDMAEVLYPYHTADAAYSTATGVPAILHTTLPHLTQQHDDLFQRLGDYIQQQPMGSMRSHYDRLFAWLAQEYGKSVWVERSGGICVCIDLLYAMYPDANFIHIVRDGRNTAMSMAHHKGFRMFMLAATMTQYLGVDPFESSDRTNIDQLPKELHCFLPESFDREAFLNFQFSFQAMGELWTQQMHNGIETLNKVPAKQVLTVRYEAFCETPQAHLKKVTDFIGVESTTQWLDATVQDVKLSNASWLDQPESIQNELEAACRSGMALMESLDCR